MYSNIWNPVKIAPKIRVINIGVLIFIFFCIIWCAQVTLAPDERRIAVFNKGTLKGSKGITSMGGQIKPISCTGVNLLWKKDQNHAIKNNTSLKINKNIPHFKPSWTFRVWSPKKVDSREISRHHNREKNTKSVVLKINKNVWLNLKKKTILDVIAPPANPQINGQGLTLTKWKEWKIFIIL
jgi:hypothetical protein